MNEIRKYLVVVLVFIVTPVFCQGFSQVPNGPGNSSLEAEIAKIYDYKGSFSKASKGINGIDGTPMVFDEKDELKLFIIDNSGREYQLPFGNYNSISDEIVSMYSKDSIYAYDESEIKYAKIDNLIIKKYQSEKNEKKRFYFELTNTDVKLLKGYFSRVIEGATSPMTMEKLKRDKYKVYDEYFVSTNGSNALEFKLKEKSILKLFKDRKEEIIAFKKDNKLSYKKEDDVIKIFNHYNSLLAN